MYYEQQQQQYEHDAFDLLNVTHVEPPSSPSR